MASAPTAIEMAAMTAMMMRTGKDARALTVVLTAASWIA